MIRGHFSGERCSTEKRCTFMTFSPEIQAEFPDASRQRVAWYPDCSGDAVASRGIAIGVIMIRRTRFVLFRKTNQPAQNLCRPGGDRHRERAVVQGTAGAER